jgi:hypothetical protein
VIDIFTADCLNIYYADSSYQSLPSASVVAAMPNTGGAPWSGAFTGTDATGSPVVIFGGYLNMYQYRNGAVSLLYNSSTPLGVGEYRFAQYASTVYAQGITLQASYPMQAIALDDSSANPAGVMSFTGSITANVLTVQTLLSGFTTNPLQVGSVLTANNVTPNTTILSLGTGTGGLGTYNVSTTANIATQTINANIPPVGNVLATVGQFLMVGDLSVPYAAGTYVSNAFSLGTGDGSTTTFTGTIPNIPIRARSVIVAVSGSLNLGGLDDGQGGFANGQTISFGTINYGTGAITITFYYPPANTAPVTVSYAQAFPNRVQWSAIGLPQFWPLPLTNAAIAFQSGYQDMEGELGPVMGIAGYPLYAVIFQKHGITRATYQGGNVVFAFATYERKRGLLARNAYVQVSAYTYFLAEDGFFVTDGANVTPIGTAPDNSAGIDDWFWSNVNTQFLSNISAGYDATLRCVIFAIPTGTNGTPDTLLIYNIIAQRWTKASVACLFVWTDSDGKRSRIGVFTRGALAVGQYNLLTGTPSIGYMESMDVFFADGQRRLTTSARPQVMCTDQPQVIIGNRDSLLDPVLYANGNYVDRFSRLAPCLSSGIYTRARVQSAAAQTLHGITLNMEIEGGV